MAIMTWTSSSRGERISSAGYAPCCGLEPEVRLHRRRDWIVVRCLHPGCVNHADGVLCYPTGAPERWAGFATTEPVALAA